MAVSKGLGPSKGVTLVQVVKIEIDDKELYEQRFGACLDKLIATEDTILQSSADDSKSHLESTA